MGATRLDLTMLLGALVLLAAIVAVRFATRIALPGLLVYLAIGLCLQSVIHFDDARRAQTLGLAALVLILAEGGLTTRWEDVRPAVVPALLLSTFGVAISMGITALIAHLVLGGSWKLAFLLGAVVSSTDAAAVFSMLRRLKLPTRLAGVLEVESGLNDAPAVIAVVLLSSHHPQHNAGLVIALVLYELVVGASIGFGVSWLGAQALRRLALPASGLYPLAVLALAVAGFATAALAHASGFLAVYVAGVVLGNSRLPHRPATRSFAEGIAWLAQISLFIMLGVLVIPSALPREILPAIAVGSALLLLARPASVAISLLPLRIRQIRIEPFRRAEQIFLAWAGLRGAVPIVLATVPVTAGVPRSRELFGLVFVLVVVFTLVQGPTLPMVARLLGLVVASEPSHIDVEAAPLEDLDADVLQLRIPEGSLLHGVEIFELRLPRGAAVTLVVRDGVSFVPSDQTQLRSGDSLLIITTASTRVEAERRLRAVSRRGKLAAWYGERGL
ncbi:MAG TPA: potassium/proton antiporter [Acidothermaceae bacterium]|jgi:cell volume regulation protein A|nr:potassium/proton antiporter [Acidothermaceae bacterium]